VILSLLAASVLLPGAVAAAIAAAARLLPAGSRLRRGAVLLALALGYASAQVAIAGMPALPPVDTTQGLFPLALLAAVLGVVADGAGRWTRLAMRLAAVLLVLQLSLAPLARNTWTLGTTIVAWVALAAASLLLWWAYDRVAERLSASGAGAATSTAWMVVYAGVAALLLCARTALLAQLASTVVVALVAAAMVAPARDGARAVGLAGLPFLAPMLHALILNGVFYAELGTVTAVALAASPLAAVAALAPRRAGPRLRAALAALAVAVVLAPFVARAASEYLSGEGGFSEYGE